MSNYFRDSSKYSIFSELYPIELEDKSILNCFKLVNFIPISKYLTLSSFKNNILIGSLRVKFYKLGSYFKMSHIIFIFSPFSPNLLLPRSNFKSFKLLDNYFKPLAKYFIFREFSPNLLSQKKIQIVIIYWIDMSVHLLNASSSQDYILNYCCFNKILK